MTIAESFIAVSEHSGIHIPEIFVRGYEQFLTYKDKEKLKEWVRAILEEEDHDDEWIRLLENAHLIIEGKEYTLWQDGDVHAFPCDKHIQWVPDDEELSDNLLDEMYREMLDSCFQDVNVCNTYTYTTSRVLKEVDPTAYRCGYADWLDSELENKALTEHGGKYYDGELKIPESFSEYIEDMDEYEGHFEWKKVTPAIDYEKGITEIEFEPTDATVYGRALHTYVFEELMDQHHGHLGYRNREPTEKEWKILHSLGYTDIPAHQTMENH